jgi:hypothetical protein
MKCDDMGGRLTDRFIFTVDQPPGYSKEPRSAAEMHFDEAVLSPPMLRAFLQAMPKGAELHYHLTGGAYAENLIRSDANRGACIAVNKAEALARRLLVAAVSIATGIARSSAPPGPQSTSRGHAAAWCCKRRLAAAAFSVPVAKCRDTPRWTERRLKIRRGDEGGRSGQGPAAMRSRLNKGL